MCAKTMNFAFRSLCSGALSAALALPAADLGNTQTVTHNGNCTTICMPPSPLGPGECRTRCTPGPVNRPAPVKPPPPKPVNRPLVPKPNNPVQNVPPVVPAPVNRPVHNVMPAPPPPNNPPPVRPAITVGPSVHPAIIRATTPGRATISPSLQSVNGRLAPMSDPVPGGACSEANWTCGSGGGGGVHWDWGHRPTPPSPIIPAQTYPYPIQNPVPARPPTVPSTRPAIADFTGWWLQLLGHPDAPALVDPANAVPTITSPPITPSNRRQNTLQCIAPTNRNGAAAVFDQIHASITDHIKDLEEIRDELNSAYQKEIGDPGSAREFINMMRHAAKISHDLLVDLIPLGGDLPKVWEQADQWNTILELNNEYRDDPTRWTAFKVIGKALIKSSPDWAELLWKKANPVVRGTRGYLRLWRERNHNFQQLPISFGSKKVISGSAQLLDQTNRSTGKKA